MKKIIILIISFAILIGIVFTQRQAFGKLFQPSTAYAVGDLIVNWGVPTGQPLFSIVNSKPGDTFSKTVSIHNGASSARPVAIRGIKISDIGILSNALTIAISQNGADLYGGSLGEKTLTQFFAESGAINGIPLSIVPSNSSTQYQISVSFKQSAGNEYQNKTLTFDLHIGIAFDIPESCKGIKFNGDPIFGTQGNDTIMGTIKNDLIIGFEGKDKIDGGLGDDCIIGGLGNDSLSGGNGNDALVDMEGDNKLDGGNGNDIIHAGNGNDEIDAGNDNDVVYGEGGNDKILLGNGNDFGDGGAGTDTINGGNGKDTCVSETKTYCEL